MIDSHTTCFSRFHRINREFIRGPSRALADPRGHSRTLAVPLADLATLADPPLALPNASTYTRPCNSAKRPLTHTTRHAILRLVQGGVPVSFTTYNSATRAALAVGGSYGTPVESIV